MSQTYPPQYPQVSMIEFNKSITGIGEVKLQSHGSILQFSHPLYGVSNAPWLGGSVSHIDGVLNLKVSKSENNKEQTSIEQTFANAFRDNHLRGRFIGLMTAASMKSFRLSTKNAGKYSLVCAVTAGLANARRIGDSADVCERAEENLPAGTINVVFATNAPLSPAAQLEAFALMTEAKTAACYDAKILSLKSNNIATGTGTDATVVVSRKEENRDLLIPYCGKHTQLGELIGQAAYDAISSAIEYKNE